MLFSDLWWSTLPVYTVVACLSCRALFSSLFSCRLYFYLRWRPGEGAAGSTDSRCTKYAGTLPRVLVRRMFVLNLDEIRSGMMPIYRRQRASVLFLRLFMPVQDLGLSSLRGALLHSSRVTRLSRCSESRTVFFCFLVSCNVSQQPVGVCSTIK